MLLMRGLYKPTFTPTSVTTALAAKFEPPNTELLRFVRCDSFCPNPL